MLDTTRTIETPEGVELSLRIAGPVVRSLAWAIDMAIRAVIYFTLAFVLGWLDQLGNGLLLLSIFLLEWFYPVLFEVYRQGATPGKRRMGIKVLRQSGVPVDWSASLLRNLLRVADFLPLLYGFGLLSMIFSDHFQRLGDLAAGTLVVYDETADPQVALPEVEPLALPVLLDLEEQRALVSFAERAQTLSSARAQELADLVVPLSGAHGEAGVRRLYQMANGLLGRR